MEFKFAVAEDELPPPSGFDLGHVDVWGSKGRTTSRDRRPDQAMMIYLSLTLLLDGLRYFLVDGNRSSYESAAVDSSFSLKFTRGREDDGSIETTHGGVLLDRSTTRELATAVYKAAKEFAQATLPNLPPDDAGREDLEKSLAEFEDFLAGLEVTGCGP
ncbi:hypothetical protein [Streptomyces cupreus]|uniref:Uncharacterized protein n=1 Tax=Streptomyces cupreus TaxID=2759956 RepID=A0A7X1JCH6_9ACTN|nr:hypothetical protein [Streptomyces cupreus]MBC2908236.1 hypothetical protein [Streptomyces cupreus]